MYYFNYNVLLKYDKNNNYNNCETPKPNTFILNYF